jgi:ATP-dependent Zn protease
MAGLAATDAVACEDAVITIKTISPTSTIPDWVPEWEWLRNMFPDPSTVTVTYSSSTSYTPLEGKDSWEISGTNTELDGGNWKILKIPSSGTVTIKCKSKKCSNVVSTTGKADVNCADFSDRMNARISDAATDIASTVGKSIKGFADVFTGNIPLILFIISIIAVVFFVIPLFKKGP